MGEIWGKCKYIDDNSEQSAEKYNNKELKKLYNEEIHNLYLSTNIIKIIPVWEIEINDRRDPLRWPRNTLYPQKLALLRQEAAGARSA
jgi:hypothetical protein